jgi:hypothetical protein
VAEEAPQEALAAEDLVAEVKDTETTLELQEQTLCQTQDLAVAVVEQTLVVQESARLSIG